MQRDSGIINDITGCFPLVWTECDVCGREFRFETGWLYYTRYGDSRYYCKKCCKTKKDVVNKMK